MEDNGNCSLDIGDGTFSLQKRFSLVAVADFLISLSLRDCNYSRHMTLAYCHSANHSLLLTMTDPDFLRWKCGTVMTHSVHMGGGGHA